MKKNGESHAGRVVCSLCLIVVTVSLFASTPGVYAEPSAGCDDAAAPIPVRTANWELARRWLPERVLERVASIRVEPNWLPDDDRFWYRYRTKDGVRYWLVNPAIQGKDSLFDCAHVAGELTRLTGEPVNALTLDLGELTFTEEARVFRFELGEDRFEYDRAAEELVRLEASAESEADDAETEPWQNLSPDGKTCVYGRGHDLYLSKTDAPPEEESRLTTDGVEHFGWGGLNGAPEDPTERRLVFSMQWSKDSRYFCVGRSDEREVEDLWLIDHLHRPRPTLQTFKCSMPGEKVARGELWLCDVETKELTKVDTERWPDQILWDLFAGTTWWSEDSSILYFTRRSRDYFSVDLCAVDPATGEVRVLIEERIHGQVYIKDLIELPKLGKLLWWSMRDGWGHFYVYDRDGNLEGQLTQGSFNVDEVVEVDEDAGVVFFTANGREEGRNVYYRHLYRVRLDGSSLKLLTPEDAEHACAMSTSRKYFVDNFSTVSTAPEVVVRDANGKLVLELEKTDLSRLKAAGWRAPEVFRAKSADGVTDQWGVMYRPHDFDPSRKYPIITRVYPGRQGEFVTREFRPVNLETVLAQLGFIVVQFGNRGGTYERGLAYREHEREEFRNYGLADKKVVIEQLAERFPWIDLDRVGIYGGSSGGFMTTSAMLVYPEFFRVGVAMTAPNDPSVYYNLWAERYYGVEQVTEEDGTVRWVSEPEGNLEIADQLQGRLLMIYGEADGNVHPTHMHRMAQAFVEAGKRFDMLMIPGGDHGLGDWRYLYGVVWDYFTTHLLGDPRESVDCFPGPSE